MCIEGESAGMNVGNMAFSKYDWTVPSVAAIRHSNLAAREHSPKTKLSLLHLMFLDYSIQLQPWAPGGLRNEVHCFAIPGRRELRCHRPLRLPIKLLDQHGVCNPCSQ